MGTASRGAPATLPNLPHDVLLHIIDRMTPAQITLFSQLCTSTAEVASDPAIWASLARRHLGIAPPHHTLSAAQVSALAASLVSRWWLASGIFVAGVPVHFRKGFCEVRARGGVERALGDAAVAAYVFGGNHKEAAVPVAVPGVTMHFFLDAAGPFPMDGMLLRLVHVSEPAEGATPFALTPPALSEPAPPAEDTCPPDQARVHIKVNNITVATCLVPSGEHMSVLDVLVKPELLQTKPRMNTLSVEYDRASTAAYWLKSVDVAPCILPMPAVSQEDLRFAPCVPDKMPVQWVHVEEPLTPPLSEADVEEEREERGAMHGASRARDGERSPPPRRVVGQTPHGVKARLPEVAGARFPKHGKMGKQARKPKHVFHHNHYRSPRGHAPGSPRARAGR